MDYVEMIKDPELVLGFQELVTDSDAVVVKRAVKVFTCVYHHTLRLLSVGELEEEILLQSWSSVNGVVDRLLAMVRHCNNEGILIHLLRFLEAAVTAHLSFDVSRCPSVFERGREVIKTGLKALKDLITTPYVGGSIFIFGVRSLISIACLRPDLWEPVTDLLKKQIASLPPTLFDHNVRSLNKTLQRNLFRLLRRADRYELKEKLIEMMVGVGVPRKAIAPWAPQALETRKRSPPEPSNDYMLVIGRVTPPEKKARLDTVRRSQDKEGQRSRSNTPEIPKDPRLTPPLPQEETPSEEMEMLTQKKTNNADLLFLTSLIPKPKNTEITESSTPEQVQTSPEQSSSENELYKLLNLNNVCSLVIQNINDVPDTKPDHFVSSYTSCGIPTADTEMMRSRLSSLLVKCIDPSYINQFKLNSQVTNSDFPNTASTSSKSKRKDERVNSGSSSASCTPPSTPVSSPPPSTSVSSPPPSTLISSPPPSTSVSSPPRSTSVSSPPLADTDMRQVYQRPTATACDVDMRIPDSRLMNRDPRLAKDPRTRRDVDCRIVPEVLIDPRLDKSNLEPIPRIDPRTHQHPNQRVDARFIENQRVDSRPIEEQRIDPRSIKHQRVDPRFIENQRIDPRFIENQRIDPRSIDPRKVDPRSLENKKVDPRFVENQETEFRLWENNRIDPRSLETRRIDPRTENQRIDPRTENQRIVPRTENQRIDPRTGENPKLVHMPMESPTEALQVEHRPRMDPRLASANRKNVEPRKSRWDPRPSDELRAPSLNRENELPSHRESEFPIEGGKDPRRTGGLLPDPYPIGFQRENMDPRFPFPKPVNVADLQPQSQPQPQPNFMPPQAPFTFNPVGQFNNPFMGGIGMPPHNGMAPMFNSIPFGWNNNNVRNAPTTVILAQTLATVQQGLLSPTLMNR